MQARELAALEADTARVVAAYAALNEVTRPDRPYGLLSDEELQTRIEATSARAAALAERVQEHQRRERELAERVAAVRAQVQGELVDERTRLTAALHQADVAGGRRTDAHDDYRRAQQHARQLQAALAEKNRGVRGWLPSPERTRMEERLQEVSRAMDDATRRAEVAERARQAALHAARQASPACGSLADLRERQHLLSGRASFAAVLETTTAARLQQVAPDLADRQPAAAARLSFPTASASPEGQIGV